MEKYNKTNGLLTKMYDQLDKVISDMQDLNEEDIVYYQAIKKIIDFKLNEEEVKSQFKALNDVMIASARLDFSKRLNVENSKDLFAYLGSSLNMLNEELEANATSKELLEQVMEKVMTVKPDLALLTNPHGKIEYVSANSESVIGFKKEKLLNKRIQNFFATNIQFKNTEIRTPYGKEVDLINSSAELVSVLLKVEEIRLTKGVEPCYLYMLKEKGVN